MRDNPGSRGFTLVELLVVIAIIAALAIMVLPSAKGMFSMGGETQARTLISSLLGTARATAIEQQTYSLAHFQIGTDNRCWVGVFQMESTSGRFTPSVKFPPQAMPGDYACAVISNDWVDAGGHFKAIQNDFNASGLDLCNLTCLNVIFAPDGSLVTQARDPLTNQLTNPMLDVSASIFADPDIRVRVWDVDNRHIGWRAGTRNGADPGDLGKAGVRGLALFNYKAIATLSNGNYGTARSRANFLETNCSFLAINPVSGQLIRSK